MTTITIKINKILEFIKKNYIYVNITFLILAIYIVLFPLIAALMEKINPNITKCSYLLITGKPCPLCGGTRYVKGLYNNLLNFKYYLHPFGIMIVVVFFEIIYRMLNIISFNKKKSDRYIKLDIMLHIILIACFFIYEFTFIFIQNIREEKIVMMALVLLCLFGVIVIAVTVIAVVLATAFSKNDKRFRNNNKEEKIKSK